MRTAAIALSLAATLAGCSKKDTGCKKDTECKGNRICVKGRCQAPSDSTSKDKAQGQAKGQTASPRGPFGMFAPPPAPPPPGGSGGSAGPAVPLPPSGQPLSLKICVDNKCVDLGQSMGFGGGFQFGLPGGRGRKRFRYWHHQSPFSPPGGSIAKDPPGKITYRSLGPIKKAGPDAVGRVAEFKGLAITTVRDHELVLQGKGRTLLVLSVPPHLKHLIKGLRTRTTKVTARFHVTQPVAGDLVRGELLDVK